MQKKLLTLITAFFVVLGAFAQSTIKGKVVNDTGTPLVKATIKIAGKTVVTDESGSFTAVAKPNDKVVVSYLGMNDVYAKAQDGMTITMTPKTGSETEVIVTGYSVRNKRNNTGSATSVGVDDLKTQPIASFDQLLQGQAAGLSAKSGSGQPGASAQVIIRGRGSSLGSVTPLYIIDGVEMSPSDFSTINPADFETVTVLKDAVTAGIYGSRGSNGVIVITTKKGKAGATKFNYDFQYGASKFPTNKLKLMSTAEKLAYEKVNGNPNGWSATQFDSLGKINTNWEDVFFRTGITQSHQLSASGGNEKNRFYTSFGYFNQTGIVKATDLKRYTARINVETGGDRIKVGINTQLGYSEFSNTTENNQGIASPLNSIRWTLPYFTPKNAAGDYVQDPTPSGQPNALQELLENTRQFPQIKGIGNIFGEYQLPWTAGLSIRTNVGMDFRNDQSNVFNAPTSYIGRLATGGKGSLARSSQNSIRITNTNSINYKKNINKIHDITVLAAQESVLRKSNSFSYTGFGFTEPFFQNAAGITPGTGGVSSNGFIPNVGGGGSERRLVSYFVDAGYSYKNKIFGNFNVRKDVSSAFAASKSSTLLGGVGAAWILSEEDFLKGSTQINFLKIKASYGKTGNQELNNDFGYITTLAKNTYAGQNGLFPDILGNPSLTWETKTTANFGVDFTILKNRVKGGIEYYNSKTANLFNLRRIPYTTGFSSQLSNVGSLRNNGIEITLGTTLKAGKNFTWDISGNFTYNKNQVLTLPDGESEIEDVNGLTTSKIGSPLLSFKMNKYLGVDPATGKSIYGTLSGGKTNDYNASNAQVFGTADAPYFGGITNTFTYRDIQLSFFWTYSFGNEIYNNDRVNIENPAYIASSISRDLLREWRNPGDITDIPSPKSNIDVYQSLTTRYLENGSFWRLRNIEMSYNLPKNFSSSLKIAGARVFVQGQNLLTITKFRGFDPEITTPSLGGAQYPSLRTVTAGFSINF